MAADLGLSRSQFYRDLTTARLLIDKDIRGRICDRMLPSDDLASSFDAKIRRAYALAAPGQGHAALEYFAPIVAALASEDRAWGHSFIADLLFRSGDLNAASRELKLATELCSNEDWQACAHTLVIRAKLLHEDGDAAKAARLLERAIGRLQCEMDKAPGRVVEAYSDALSWLTFCYQERGDFTAASKMNSINPASENDPRISVRAQVQFHNVSAMLACESEEGSLRVRDMCNTFYDFALQGGLIDEIAAALLQTALASRYQRRLEEALDLAQEALAIERSIGGRCASIMNVITAITMDMRDYRLVTELSRQTRANAARGSHAWWSSHLYEAESLLNSGELRSAAAICKVVGSDGPVQDSRIAAWRKRLEAMILYLQGDCATAERTVESALEVLGEAAPPFHRLKILRVAQEIHPTHSRRRQMRHLTATLGWPLGTTYQA